MQLQIGNRPYKGTIIQWDDNDGYGFIRVTGKKSNKIFFHISAYRGANRPREGELVVFTAGKRNGRMRANKVKPQFELQADVQLDTPSGKAKPKRFGLSWGKRFDLWRKAAISLGIAGAWFYGLWRYASPLFYWYAILSVLLFLLYVIDKRSALKGNWRTSELKLHIFALFGGWIGGLFGRYLCNHKTTKPSFVWAFWITVAINLAFTYYAVQIDHRPLLWLANIESKAVSMYHQITSFL